MVSVSKGDVFQDIFGCCTPPKRFWVPEADRVPDFVSPMCVATHAIRIQRAASRLWTTASYKSQCQRTSFQESTAFEPW